MATTATTKTTTEGGATKESTVTKIGGDTDFILLDENDRPMEALTRADAGVDGAPQLRTPFRITNPRNGKIYEHVGEDEFGRATYRLS